MQKNITTPNGNRDDLIKKVLREQFQNGRGMAEDPLNANLPALALRVTTIHSPWFTETCKVCKQKFREGDQVRLCPRCGRPFHDDLQYDLHCWHNYFAKGCVCTPGGPDRYSDDEIEIERCEYRFTGELPDEHLCGKKKTDSVVTSRCSPSAELVKRFVGGLERMWPPVGGQSSEKVPLKAPIIGRNCPWCRFKVRAGDWVVACPCGCGTYFHQDVFRHLTCWNEWNGVEGNKYCPITGRDYEPS